MPETAELVVEGKKLSVSNLNKVLYPKVGFTKGQVIDYYIRIAPILLPHLEDRPLTMKRYPNGVDKEFFYEKNCPTHRPTWVKTAKVWSEGNNRMMEYCLAQDLPTLVWAANLADLELHTSLARKKDEHKTTICVYSLRAREEPTVSTPVTWDEVATCLKKKKADLLKFRSDKVLARVEKQGDLFDLVEKLKQKLPKKWKL